MGLLRLALSLTLAVMMTGCSGEDTRIIRIGHNQSTEHPTHVGLLAMEEYIEGELGDRYRVEVYPSELLGSQTDMVQLTQTGAIDFCVASNAILETFSKSYEIFNLPYLFTNEAAYHAVMDDEEITSPLFASTERAGFVGVTWLDAGTRSFYTVKSPINTPEDLRGLKIRVQQSPTNVEMMRLLGGSATPMGFGDVYTALQAGIIDGAENNELALTNNGHGDVCRYYSYDMHQMVPDILIGNAELLKGLSEEEAQVFNEAFRRLNQVQRQEWQVAVAAAGERAAKVQGVEFIYPDQEPFMEACLPLHKSVLEANPDIEGVYERIQEYNEVYKE